MSSSKPEENGSNSKKENDASSEDDSLSKLECAVCLQTCIHPVRLPCRHVFCFLCVKGVANQSKSCALCRQEIPSDYLDNPDLLTHEELEEQEVFDGGYLWYYEGRNGWWQYDERTSSELENAFKQGNKRCEVLIAGFLYIIDFEHMVQMRRSDLSRRRRIKRDSSSLPKKGIAGIRVSTSEAVPNDAVENHSETDGLDTDENIPKSPGSLLNVPTNTPMTPQSPGGSSDDENNETNEQHRAINRALEPTLTSAIHRLRIYDQEQVRVCRDNFHPRTSSQNSQNGRDDEV